jgi:hypothetical protein
MNILTDELSEDFVVAIIKRLHDHVMNEGDSISVAKAKVKIRPGSKLNYMIKSHPLYSELSVILKERRSRNYRSITSSRFTPLSDEEFELIHKEAGIYYHKKRRIKEKISKE